MPTYQYACTDCGDRTEVVQKFTDDPLSVCATCGGKLRKVFSPVGIVFKGSGFYRNDSRNSSPVGAGGPNGKDHAAKDKDGASASSEKSSSNGDSSGSKSESGSSSSSSSGSSGSGSGSSGEKKSAPAASGSSSSSSSGSKVA